MVRELQTHEYTPHACAKIFIGTREVLLETSLILLLKRLAEAAHSNLTIGRLINCSDITIRSQRKNISLQRPNYLEQPVELEEMKR